MSVNENIESRKQRKL